MKKFSWKNILKWFLKAILSLAALYLVFRKIDIPQLTSFASQLQWNWLVPAFLLFNLSKILSATRLNMLFENAGLKLDHQKNILLYYVGMFYNLFLPGGIGGDGYKVYFLHKQYKAPVKPFISAVLYDRINGVTALGFMAGLLGMVLLPQYRIYSLFAVLLAFPVLWLGTYIFFRRFLPSFLQGNFYSLGVQITQVLSVLCILRAMQFPTVECLPYLLLFLVSSIAAALPFSIGGIGARELVFVYGATYLGTDMPTGVFISMLFFMLTALSSLPGIFIPQNAIRPEANSSNKPLAGSV